jgi:hypothetical protein
VGIKTVDLSNWPEVNQIAFAGHTCPAGVHHGMSEEAPIEPVVYDVIVDLGNGTHVKVEKGLSRVAAQIARKRVSKFFLDVCVVEQLREVGPRGRSPDATSD